MSEINKARQVREALGLSRTEAGQLLLGYRGKQAYDQWSQWEAVRRKPSRAAERLLDVFLLLAEAQESGRPGVDGALEYLLAALNSADDGDDK